MKNHSAWHLKKSLIPRLMALLLAMCFLPVFGLAEDTAAQNDDWVTFLLICNEGMNNDKGNAGNTLMNVAINEVTGRIKLLVFTWDTFVDYEGYDVPQKLDMPYRNNGPEEAMKVFNANFGMDITKYMSLNYLNLASLIDSYGGVTVDISRAERNALNGMVASKKWTLQQQVNSGLLAQTLLESLASDYYLEEFGPETHLNGLQAVGFGWLQYDSVYNCCLRELKVIASLFGSVGNTIAQHVVFYTDESGKPEEEDGRRPINLDNLTDDDVKFLMLEMEPIFEKSFNNLTEEDIVTIGTAIAKTAYLGSRQGVNIFEHVDIQILPLEALNEYDIVAGSQGHLIDKEKNAEAVRKFLYADD